MLNQKDEFFQFHAMDLESLLYSLMKSYVTLIEFLLQQLKKSKIHNIKSCHLYYSNSVAYVIGDYAQGIYFCFIHLDLVGIMEEDKLKEVTEKLIEKKLQF